MKFAGIVIQFDSARSLKERPGRIAFLALLLLGAAAAVAGELHTWSQGDALTAADLNANFSALARLSVASETANYTLGSADDLVLANGSGGAFTLTLPAASASNLGKVYRLKRTDNTLANVVGIATSSSQTIDGQASLGYSLNTQNEEYTLLSDGVNWQILTHKTATPYVSYSLQITSNSTPYPTKGATTLDVATWRRVGDSIEINYSYDQSGGGSAGAGAIYFFSLPLSLTIDGSKATATAIGNGIAQGAVGAAVATSGGAVATGIVQISDPVHLAIVIGNSEYATTWVSSSFFYFGSSGSSGEIRYSFHATVPIAGWTE